MEKSQVFMLLIVEKICDLKYTSSNVEFLQNTHLIYTTHDVCCSIIRFSFTAVNISLMYHSFEIT